MTNRENFFAAVCRRNPERVPFYFTMCQSLTDAFEKQYGTRDYFTYYDMPFRMAGIKPTQHKTDFSEYFKRFPQADEITEWGVGLAHSGDYHFASFVSPMQDFETPEEVYAFPLPDVLSDYRWEGLKERIAELKAQDYVTLSGPDEAYIQIFEFAWYLRGLENLMLDPYFAQAMNEGQRGLRQVCAAAALHGVPAPSMMSALSYYDGYRASHLPANLLQAQRDFFGAHTYERTDAARGIFFHTNWTGEGGDTAASTYNV